MSTSLTVAHVLGSFGMGGAERVALDLAVMQKRLGQRVLAVSLDPGPEGPLGPLFRAAGIAVCTVPKRPGIDATLLPRIAALLRRERVIVLHTHNPIPLIYAAPAGRAAGTAVIHTKHGEGHMGSRGEKLLRRLASPLAHWFVAVSDETAEQALAQRDCLLRSRLRVIRNGIALDRFCPDRVARAAVRAELGVADDAWLVGTVGRVDGNKNQSALVRAVAPLLADSFQLVLVGDGPAMDEVRAAVAALPRPELVHVLGRRMDTPRILAALDVFALPSLSEGLPLVIPEAMAAALPVVSTAVGGIPAVVHEAETGYLVPAGDEQALRARLAALAVDRAGAAALGTAGRARALGEYSAERMTREYLELYEQALPARARG